jgi:hypothetical protein
VIAASASAGFCGAVADFCQSRVQTAGDLSGELCEVAGDGVLQRLLVFPEFGARLIGVAGDHLDRVEALIEAGGAVGGGGGEGGNIVAEDGYVHMHAGEGGFIFLALLHEAVGGVADDALHLTEAIGDVEDRVVQSMDGGVQAALKPAQPVAHGIRFGAIALWRNNWCAVD